MKPLIIVALCVVCLWCETSAVRASNATYDKEEAIRRDAEKLVQYDKQQRDAAKRRADERERAGRRTTGDDFPAYVFFGGLLAVGLIVALTKFQAYVEERAALAQQQASERETRTRSAAALDRVLAERRAARARTNHPQKSPPRGDSA
jgi:hypothetical protein